MAKCMYCKKVIEGNDCLAMGRKYAHPQCFHNYLTNVDELTEFISIDGGDCYGARSEFHNKKENCQQ